MGRNGLEILYLLLVILVLMPSGAVSAADAAAPAATQAVSGGDVQKEVDTHILPGVAVTATKTDTPVEYAPVTAYTVDRKNIESQPDYIRSNYGQLIQDVPGVYVAQATYKTTPWINLRGTGDFSARSLYMVDGLPVGSSQMLTYAINNNDIDRIEILMGPSSALYGSNAAGGVVNIITRQGTESTGATVSYSYGSNDTNRPHVSIGDSVPYRSNRFNYYFSYSGDYSDGYENLPIENTMRLYREGKKSYLKTTSVDDAYYRTSYFAGKAGWLGANGASLTIGYNYSRSDVSGGQHNLHYVDDGYQGIGNLRFQMPIAELAKLTLTGGYQHWNRPSKDNKGLSLTPGGLVLNTNKNYANESDVWRMPLELQTDFFLGENNILTAGAFYCKEKIKAKRENWQTGAFVSESEYPMDQTAFYLQDQAFFFNKKLSVLAGIRYDRWKYHDIYDSTANPKEPDDYDDDIVNYRGGIKYQINDALAIRTSAGTAYYPGLSTWFFKNVTTPPSLVEANPNLDPEETWMVDLGLDGNFVKTGTSFSITAYYGRIKDIIAGRYDSVPGHPTWTVLRYSNVGEAEIYGLETQLNQRLSEHLFAVLNLTLNHSEIVDDPVNEGNQVSTAPDYMFNIGLKYLNPGLINGSIAFRAIDDMHIDNENINVSYFAMDSYESIDAKIWRDWKVSNKVTLSTALSVENLLDDGYEPYFYYENPGRTFMATVGINYSL